jgi:hypothetical protein
MWSPAPPHFETTQNALFVSRGAVSKPTLGGWCRVGPSLRRLSISVCLLLLLTTGLKASERPWLFSPPKAVEPPQVKQADWIRNPLDAFVLARLDSKGLQPASDASPQTLIRRIYFDLIGLPPRPQEVEAFLTDKDPRAYEQLVGRLLEDQRYGERWARFWLDLARYADTAGYEGDPDLPHAWRYRDYVIDAFNNDMPYDQFIKEQLAGDEFDKLMGAGDLPDVPPDRVVALTFLRLAPFTEPRGDDCAEVDQPVAALLSDLKQRGMLDETLVVWASEMGRTPFKNGAMSNKPGREHNSWGLCMWMAGGNVKPGATVGATDEFSLRAADDPVPIRDVHATILDLLGLDDNQLRYLHAGRYRQLTDIGGNVLTEMIV